MTSDHTNVDVSVRIHGDKVAEYHHDGRVYVEAREGTEYALYLKNNNPYRVKVVVSVDGVSVITGQPADTSEAQAGYIINAHSTLTIKGYRLDNDNVAAFKFTKAEGSYAQTDKGMTSTTGVIGVRAYRERLAPPPIQIKEVHHHHDNWVYPRPYWDRYPYFWYSTDTKSHCSASSTNDGGLLRSMSASQQVYTCSTSSVTPSNALMSDAEPARTFDMGSSFGTKTESQVVETTFTVDACLGELTLYYASRAGLQALGIDFSRASKVVFPEAFSSKYCKPPSGYKG